MRKIINIYEMGSIYTNKELPKIPFEDFLDEDNLADTWAVTSTDWLEKRIGKFIYDNRCSYYGNRWAFQSIHRVLVLSIDRLGNITLFDPLTNNWVKSSSDSKFSPNFLMRSRKEWAKKMVRMLFNNFPRTDKFQKDKGEEIIPFLDKTEVSFVNTGRQCGKPGIVIKRLEDDGTLPKGSSESFYNMLTNEEN